jgi:hypothetical protein
VKKQKKGLFSDKNMRQLITVFIMGKKWPENLNDNNYISR